MDALPDPFPTSKFRPETTENFSNKILLDRDRKYVVQTLATMLMTFVSKPSLTQCGKVAETLVSRYDFLRDDCGEGEVSALSYYKMIRK